MNKTKFAKLTKTLGKYGSWAIWDNNNIESTEIIAKNFHILHSNYVFIALNKSYPSVNYWQNFRGKRRGSHDRKLVSALNSKPFKGSYMTDLFKNTNAKNVNELKLQIRAGKININNNVKKFSNEMKEIKVTNKTKFVVFGKYTKKMFTTYFQDKIVKSKINSNNIIFYEHYSSTHITDKKWVSGLHKILNE